MRRRDLQSGEGQKRQGEQSTDSSKSSGTSASSRDPEDLGLDDPDTPTPRVSRPIKDLWPAHLTTLVTTTCSKCCFTQIVTELAWKQTLILGMH